MKVDYIIADTHFGHTNVLKYELSRVEKMKKEDFSSFDEMMISIWNNSISENDNILHLGDVAFDNEYLKLDILKGKITLIIGNHDKKEHLEYYKNIGWNVIDSIELKIDNSLKVFDTLKQEFSTDILNNNLLTCLVIDINDKRVMFSHFPVFDNNQYDLKFSNITKVLNRVFELTKCDVNIHGHTHSHGAKEDFCKSACLELNSFKVIDVNSFL
ncbi:hypothetical protein CRV02_14005 [Arcobacter sp. CECT 8989]|uniref:metallophosphoesterase family protein n=1 Tax=Arcobacter sp. CECT 8989 TaxID=2044509 RepID=UPI0010277A2C|nr:metallophosphoesterase family protein [Arcobacter sp. CECT 8989]RXJ98136.1 hypothetical protein CRV02_14005 [Arcobacter sp. CECT 8989]